jgi:hypothetical protein
MMRVFGRIAFMASSILPTILSLLGLLISTVTTLRAVDALPASFQSPIHTPSIADKSNHNISIPLFAELEELSRIVDIAYCVGVTGIWPPFECAGRCSEFASFELVDSWNTGPLLSDSCGYIALDHGKGRVIVAFRGTYSITNTILDLATVPQEYVPYPGDPEDRQRERRHEGGRKSWFGWIKHRLGIDAPRGNSDDTYESLKDKPKGPRCTNCTVHMGFQHSWHTSRPYIIPHLQRLHLAYPAYALHLVGHSLGGAVAALAALETSALGLNPTVTTFGEPRIGNEGLRDYIDEVFDLKPTKHEGSGVVGKRYRRLTHVNDPVPLLPLSEWGYRPHAGEIYISKPDLQPGVMDLRHCEGDEDSNCIFGAEAEAAFAEWADALHETEEGEVGNRGIAGGLDAQIRGRWGLPARYRMWQLVFAHRDYFWRLGLCVPGGDPADWGRGRYGSVKGQTDEL